MINIYQRQAASFRNEMRTSCAALIGVVQGLLADGHLNDSEITFLGEWLASAESVALTWPGNVIKAQIEAIMADGSVSEEERMHLVITLGQLIGGKLDEVAEAGFVTELPIDRPLAIEVKERAFCFTGDFVYGPRRICEQAVITRGGSVSSVNKKLHYLVVGGLGSREWKHGSFGTKIEAAVKHKASGTGLLILHEDTWAAALR
ncbi:BRCT domain-containing protein [Variovorax sp.]|jgi:NAD-dependent DNA ligase|uniref:BRCT domain-containing protein n=1 Tax=Variovorax sp. TaxID=1871043 RepID=UPI004037C58A